VSRGGYYVGVRKYGVGVMERNFESKVWRLEEYKSKYDPEKTIFMVEGLMQSMWK